MPYIHLTDFHLRVHRWVLWWACIGLVCGAIALVNIFTRDLTRSQDHVILLVGIIFWVLGGVVCWASEGIEYRQRPAVQRSGAGADEFLHKIG